MRKNAAAPTLPPVYLRHVRERRHCSLPAEDLAFRVVSLSRVALLFMGWTVRCGRRRGIHPNAVLRPTVRQVRELAATRAIQGRLTGAVGSGMVGAGLTGVLRLIASGRIACGTRRGSRIGRGVRIVPAFGASRRRSGDGRLNWRTVSLRTLKLIVLGACGVRIHGQLRQDAACIHGNVGGDNDVVAGSQHLVGGSKVTLASAARHSQ